MLGNINPHLDTPGRRGTNDVTCSRATPTSWPLTPALTREAWPVTAQATGAETGGQVSTERKRPRRLKEGKEATSEKTEIWNGMKG